MAMWLPINLSAVTDLDDQHTQHAVLTAADYPDIINAITPVVTQCWSNQALAQGPWIFQCGNTLIHIINNTKCDWLI